MLVLQVVAGPCSSVGDLVFTDPSSTGAGRQKQPVKTRQFKVVVVDEATQATLPSTIIPMVSALSQQGQSGVCMSWRCSKTCMMLHPAFHHSLPSECVLTAGAGFL